MKYKYIYIITLALSSLFTPKHLSANTYDYLHAIFIPRDAFIKNTTVKDLAPQQIRVQGSTKNTDSYNQNTVSTTINIKEAAPYSQEVKKQSSPQQIKQQRQPKRITQKTQTKPNNYRLGDNISTTAKKQTTTTLSTQTTAVDLQKKSTEELLSSLPFPNVNEPRFKQLYGLYGLDLRTLYQKGRLPNNTKQENTLSKANSIRRFSVK